MGNPFKRMAEALSTEIIAVLIVGAILSVGAAIWAAILSWGPLVIIVFIGGVGLTLFATNEYKKLRGKRVTDFESLVQKWLYKYRFTIQNTPQPNALFQFMATDDAGRKVIIAQLQGDKEYLTIAAAFQIAPQDQAKLDRITRGNSATVEDLKIEMARFGIGFQGITHPLKTITLEDKLPCSDKLTEFEFMQRVMFVRRAILLIQGLINRALKLSPTK